MIWRLLETGAHNGPLNMAIDEAILTAHSEGKVPPTVRFYRWDPPCISLGYFQKAEQEVDFGACRKAGVGVVRRITGGRAVLHDRELTYSLVAQEGNPKVPGNILRSYLAISKGLQEGLRLLGVATQIAEGRHRGRHSTAACFDAPSWYELTVEGKKMAGSAQTRRLGCLLQHGSVLLNFATPGFFNLLNITDEAVKIRLMAAFDRKACSLATVLGREPSYEEAVEAMTKGFERGLGIKLEKGELTPFECELAEKLASEKYSKV